MFLCKKKISMNKDEGLLQLKILNSLYTEDFQKTLNQSRFDDSIIIEKYFSKDLSKNEYLKYKDVIGDFKYKLKYNKEKNFISEYLKTTIVSLKNIQIFKKYVLYGIEENFKILIEINKFVNKWYLSNEIKKKYFSKFFIY